MSMLRRALAAAALTCTAVVGIAAPGRAADDPKITLKISDSKLGRIMTDGDGKSLYMFVPDSPNVSVCEGQCLVAWPPVMLKPTQTLADVTVQGGNLRRSRLGIAMRADGSRQLTYNGWPLYYWFRDAKAGDTLGQWVNNIWFVLNEEGTPITPRNT